MAEDAECDDDDEYDEEETEGEEISDVGDRKSPCRSLVVVEGLVMLFNSILTPETRFFSVLRVFGVSVAIFLWALVIRSSVTELMRPYVLCVLCGKSLLVSQYSVQYVSINLNNKHVKCSTTQAINNTNTQQQTDVLIKENIDIVTQLHALSSAKKNDTSSLKLKLHNFQGPFVFWRSPIDCSRIGCMRIKLGDVKR
jgi:hypothetical protein